MTRYIIECDNTDEITFGVRLIKRIIADGSEWGCSEYGYKREAKLWIAHKTKTGYSARDVNYVMGKREGK